MSDETIGAVETHISTLFFTPTRVLKLLKPVEMGFLDHTDVETRVAAVDDELRLNRRFAPDVYLGTSDIVEHGETTDRLLVMRRLPDDRRLTRLLSAPDADDHLRAVARVVADVHASAPPIDDARPLATADGLASFWRSSLEEMTPLIDGVIDRDEFDEVAGLALGYLEHRASLFEQRRRDGHVRDGHGDLVAADIYVLDDGPRVLDCLAFDADYRICDVVGDVAFLAMDVERLAGREAAGVLLEHYGELTAEQLPTTLVEHWIAYRAHVRAKVALIRHAQGSPDAAEEAVAYHRLAAEHLRRGRLRLVLVGGGPGTGKSSLARAIAQRTGWAVVDSDSARKDLHGVAHDDHDVADHPEMYEDDASRSTYDELVRRASVLLSGGVPAIVDATWQRSEDRNRMRRAAERHGAEVVEVECVVDDDVARDRIRRRSADDPSDATAELVDRWHADHADEEPWTAARRVDTAGGTPDELASELLVGRFEAT